MPGVESLFYCMYIALTASGAGSKRHTSHI